MRHYCNGIIVDGWQESMDKENHSFIYVSISNKYKVFNYIGIIYIECFHNKMIRASVFIAKTSSNLHDRLHNFQLLFFPFVFYIVCQHFFFQFLSIDLMAFKLSHQCFYSITLYFTFAYSFHITYWSKYVFRVNDVWYIIIIKSMSIFSKYQNREN